MFVSVLERQNAILEDKYHHTIVWQRYCRKLTFGLVGPAQFYANGNVCNLVPLDQHFMLFSKIKVVVG